MHGLDGEYENFLRNLSRDKGTMHKSWAWGMAGRHFLLFLASFLFSDTDSIRFLILLLGRGCSGEYAGGRIGGEMRSWVSGVDALDVCEVACSDERLG